MKEALISIETAMIAKIKGFNEECANYFNEEGGDVCNLRDYGKGKFQGLYLSLKNTDKAEFISAPTQALLQKWLREKHQLFIEILTDCTCEPKFCFEIHKFIGNPNNLAEKEWGWEQFKDYEFFLYRTYEQALEEALKITLSLIKQTNN